MYVAHTSIGKQAVGFLKGFLAYCKKRAVGFLKGFLAYCETYLLVSATKHIE